MVEAPQVLDHVEGMLVRAPPPGAGPVDALSRSVRTAPGRARRFHNPYADAGVGPVLPVVFDQ